MTKEKLEELQNFIHTTLNGIVLEGVRHISMAIPEKEWDELFVWAQKGLEK